MIKSKLYNIPIISKFVKLASLWYGKTSWWKLLVLSRKIFVVINAIIGLITVLKVTGFNADNILASMHIIGYTYVEMLTTIITRFFNWILNLLDYKIVPNVPIDQIPPVEPDFNNHSVAKHTKSMVQGGIDKIIDHYPYLKTTNENKIPAVGKSNNNCRFRVCNSN